MAIPGVDTGEAFKQHSLFDRQVETDASECFRRPIQPGDGLFAFYGSLGRRGESRWDQRRRFVVFARHAFDPRLGADEL